MGRRSFQKRRLEAITNGCIKKKKPGHATHMETPMGHVAIRESEKNKFSAMNDEQLFTHTDVNGFICPEAFAEVMHRGLYSDFEQWRRK